MELMSALTAETAMAQSRLNFQAVGSNKQVGGREEAKKERAGGRRRRG